MLLLSPLGVHCVVKTSGFLQYDKRKNEIETIFSTNPTNVAEIIKPEKGCLANCQKYK